MACQKNWKIVVSREVCIHLHDHAPSKLLFVSTDLVWPEGEEALSELAVDFINRLLVRKISDRLGAKGITNFLTFCGLCRVH